ncbi:hypothetical protein SPRG_21474 [Saprolegnia parasitica CBS 223.65]|uniref:Uncharacterized protein n=1 Tax=Saprolegnia parasitica (strain CBS 223.65) TaxID=695850 RepID=A0A067BXU1_SAPPC|nr:hypothetical protein SPRG_21474 [Saprolegnia parasitica CBS 223.65]KDO19126.1 hypothetical protein SPRG_21474 [Saprolegnia parasitica CBS 223.65]|eukprot:XP_012210159.1 hypothetical protein SPRG_21474 [Saprolegnia parasitica CBS 223.65]
MACTSAPWRRRRSTSLTRLSTATMSSTAWACRRRRGSPRPHDRPRSTRRRASSKNTTRSPTRALSCATTR